MRTFLTSAVFLLGASYAAARSGACTRTSSVPRSYRSVVRAFDNPPTSPSLPGVKCDAAESIAKEVTWSADGNVGVCGDTYNFSAGLAACCGGTVAENTRSLTMNLDLNTSREIAQAIFHIEATDPGMSCCKRCKCWGDPHCSSFDNSAVEAREKIKSFLVCDTAAILGPGRCTSRLESSEGAKNRCYGTVPGYEQNAGLCQWIGDDESYNVSTDGGPCVPVSTFRQSVSMYARNYTEGSRQREGNTEYTGVDVRGIVGERGINKQIEVRMFVKNTRNGARRTDTLTLDVKTTCGYLRNGDDDYVTPSYQEAFLAIVDTPFFKVSRHLNIQTDAFGATVAVDVMWIFSDKMYGDALQFNCKGGTDTSVAPAPGLPSLREQLSVSDAVGAAGVAAGYQHTATSRALIDDGIGAASLQSVSTRPPKATIIDSKFYVTSVNSGSEGESGFCFSSEFDEYRLPHLFNGNSSPFEDACKLYNNFDFSDRVALSSLDSCGKILSANRCADFGDIDRLNMAFSNSARERLWLRNYSQVLETCAKVYCSQEAYIPPNGTVLECYTDFLDYGASVTMSEYFPKVRTSPNSVAAGALESTSPVLQSGCTEKYVIRYYTQGGNMVEKEWVVGSGPVVFDVIGVPTKVVLDITDCSAVCGSRPNVTITNAAFTTVCAPSTDASFLCYDTKENDGECGSCLDGCSDKCE